VTTTHRSDPSSASRPTVSAHAAVSSSVIALRRSGTSRVSTTIPGSVRSTRRGVALMPGNYMGASARRGSQCRVRAAADGPAGRRPGLPGRTGQFAGWTGVAVT
jgi:hypothetical protein